MSIINRELILNNESVTIKTLKHSLKDDLTFLAQDKRIWTYSPICFSAPDIFKKQWFDKTMEKMLNNERWSFAIYYNNCLAGSSSYYKIDEDEKSLNIGYTWYHPDFWGCALNPMVKHMMLKYAFEILCFNRICFSVNSENHRSCKALEKLGISRGNIIKNYIKISDVIQKDAVIFTVYRKDFNEVEKNIHSLIESFRRK